MRTIVPLMILLVAGCATTGTRYEFDHQNISEALEWVILNADDSNRMAVEVTETGLYVDVMSK